MRTMRYDGSVSGVHYNRLLHKMNAFDHVCHCIADCLSAAASVLNDADHSNTVLSPCTRLTLSQISTLAL